VALPDRFGFTKLVVADLEASAAFYREVFGLRDAGRVQAEIADRPIDEILLAPSHEGAAMLVLLSYVGVTQPAAGEVILGFITASLDELIARAVRAGGSVVQEPYFSEQGGVRVGFVADIEGHLIEVVEG
jgi:lactoylglutathione lyase